MQLKHLNGKRAAVYTRYSSDRQDEMSIASQLTEIEAYARQAGLVLSADLVFSDEAISGQQRSRPALNRLIARAGQSPRPFDVVLVWCWSRLSRRKTDAVKLKSQLRDELGLVLLSVSEPSDPTTNEGFLSETMHEVFAEMQVREIAAHTRRGQRQAVQEGYWTGGPAPFGYRIVRIDDPHGRLEKAGRPKQRSVLEIDPIRADVVRQIFRLSLQGLGLKAIAKQLNEQGFVAPPRSNSWGSSTVREMLKNPIYAGRLVHGRRSFIKRSDGKRSKQWNPKEEVMDVAADHLRIVTDEDWAAVQDKFTENRRRGKGSGPRQIKYLFSSLIRCGVCGATFIAKTSSGPKGGPRYVKYVCGHRANRGTSVCDNMTIIDEEQLARTIIGVLEQDFYSETNIQRIVAMTREILTSQIDQHGTLRQEILDEIAQLDRELRRFTAALATTGDVPELAEEVRRRSERKALCKAQLDTIQRMAEEEHRLDDLEGEVRERIKDTLQLIRDTNSAPAFQQELAHHIEDMTAGPDGLLSMTGRLVGALPMRLVAGAGFEPATSGL